jgi:hypothetical protein
MDEEEGQESESHGGGAPAEEVNLPNLRKLLTENMLCTSDTFHVGATYAKVVYEQYREFLFTLLYKCLFKRGRALPKRKLVQLRYLYKVLRLATTDAVIEELLDWTSGALEETGVADPRAEALYALLMYHLPLLALWERALLHGPVDKLQELLPLICLVRACVLQGACPDRCLQMDAYPVRLASFLCAGVPTAWLRGLRQERAGDGVHLGAHQGAEPRAVQDVRGGDSRFFLRAAGDSALPRRCRAQKRAHHPLQGGAGDLDQHLF